MGKIKVGNNLDSNNKVLGIIGGEGQTGMGIVYICYNSEWNRIVAAKTFQERFLHSLEIRDSFKLEALAWINLDRHPFIVNALTVQDINNRPYILMDYIAPDKLGRNSLTHYLMSPVHLTQALAWGIQFCHAMEHAISRGVYPHRDIKPDNIMIANDRLLQVTDFGLAKLWGESNFLKALSSTKKKKLPVKQFNKLGIFRESKKKSIVGTPPWMAPEQFDGVTDIRSDIYSFGIVLFQMINNGKWPFMSNTIEGFKTAHQKHPLPQIESIMFPIIKKCLAKSPKNRYFNFTELSFDLEELYKKETGEWDFDLGDINIEFEDYGIKGNAFFALRMYDEAIIEFKI